MQKISSEQADTLYSALFESLARISNATRKCGKIENHMAERALCEVAESIKKAERTILEGMEENRRVEK